MKKMIGVVGSGMIGRDPFDPKCWSRLGFNLFTTARRHGVLFRAIGVEVPHPWRGALMLKNVHPNRRMWAGRFNLDPLYYGALTREIRKSLRDDDFDKDNVILQIGGHYNGFRASGGRIATYSYHDGNIGGMMKSPFFPKPNLPHARRAFEYEKAVYQDMSKIFVMAEYWRRSFIEDFSVEPRRVVNIGVGVNIEIPSVVPKDYSRQQVVYVGIDFARKGGENLVKAFRLLQVRHPDATLHIIGPPTMPSILQQPGLRNVEYHGQLSREVVEQKTKLLEVLNSGTLFVLPSLYEPFGNAALEAMLFRMPVIATNNWSFPDFVTSATGLLLEKPSDENEIAEKMDVFLSDPSRSEEAGNAARDVVLRRYTWDRVVDALHGEISATEDIARSYVS
jgi:glycosyltransferase involved in cell wall biosynthesis